MRFLIIKFEADMSSSYASVKQAPCPPHSTTVASRRVPLDGGMVEVEGDGLDFQFVDIRYEAAVNSIEVRRLE